LCPGKNRLAAARPTFGAGLLLAVANPKAWLAIPAVYTSGRIAHSAGVDALVKFGALALMIVVIMCLWLLLGASVAPLLRRPRQRRIMNVALATMLFASTALAALR
jgi:threonine/homoserine/homoserine lactone efflux protein